MSRRSRLLGVAVGLALSLGPGVASAHDVTGSRFDAPIPLSLLFLGAGGTVALTALWLALTDQRPTRRTAARTVATLDGRTARLLRAGAGALFLAGFVAAFATGFFGRQVAAGNFATVFTWPVWFRGVALLSVLAGSPWRVLSPWRTLYRGLCRLEGREVAVVGGYPSGLGHWPALAGFVLLVGVVENLTVVPRSPRLTTVVLSVYALAMVGGAVLFGPTWFERADPLGVLYRLFGRVSGIKTEPADDGGLAVTARPPWRGCRAPVAGLTVAAFVVAAVYTVSFDGFTGTRLYQTVLFGVRDALGTGPETSVLLYLTGLAVFVAAFLAASVLGDILGGPTATGDGARANTGPGGWRHAARRFAPTVLPIAAAYEVAHNYPYVVGSVGRLVGLVGESAGVGLGAVDPLAWLPVSAFWGSQVLLVVVGHVVAVVAAHRAATDRYPSASAARRGHLPLVALMVGYTVLSLWVVSQPVVA